ncbi:uncharacterized protein K441DRAFT_674686 [Cenococcum geophilum 1.58]|uniref:uncharacterized protein n=1 Tax=Cenococcum geophilum 1.58 TaxID=794803 RepID=UPI00358FF5F5|nr:hypothetical protein K441DRAFT_674686 [Cenococcum geophilum 1.58]
MAQNVENGQRDGKTPGRVSALYYAFSAWKGAFRSLLVGPSCQDWRRPWGERENYQNFRRFRTTRMRMLLAKQDEISKLESQLHAIDQDEPAELFLGSMRLDKNPNRKDVLDDFLLRTKEILNVPDSTIGNLNAMDIWLSNTGCIARSETEYVKADDWDLLSLCSVGEPIYNDHSILANRIKNAIGEFRRRQRLGTSYKDRGIDIINVPIRLIRSIMKVITAAIAIALLLMPMVALNVVRTNGIRFLVIFFSTSSFVTALIFTTPAGMLETLAAGAAYAAVLAVFIVGNGAVGQAMDRAPAK